MTNARAPLFTVLIPLFNKGARIEATLASIAAQTFDDYEGVVVDDGSTDDGPARVAAWSDRVRLLRQANAGPGIARNRGIAAARGAWIAFLDADDLWHPDHLRTLARVIAACPDAAVVATGFTRGETLAAAPTDTGGTARYLDFFGDHGLIWTSALAVRASALATERFGAAWPGEDIELWIRLALRHRFAAHSARTAVYIQRTGGAMDSQTAAVTVPLERQPVFVTLAGALADPTLADRHAALARFRDALLIEYTRPALFNGQIALARSYLRALRAGGGRAPALYRWLARLPGPIATAGSRLYGTAKRLGRPAT